jgi:DnaK suppressor protein
VAVKDPAVPGNLLPKQEDLGPDLNEEELAQRTTGSEINASLEPVLEDQLNAVLKAKGKLQNGTYGVCESCGAEIPAERLEALPATSYCPACAK